MINSSTNFKDDTFGREPNASINMTFQNSNPFAVGILDSSFPEKANLVNNHIVRKVSVFAIFITYNSYWRFILSLDRCNALV